MRKGVWLLASLAWTAFYTWPHPVTAAPAQAGSASRHRVLVLPTRAVVSQWTLSGVEDSPEWSKRVQSNTDIALAETLAQQSDLEPIGLPAVAPDEQGVIDEFVAVATLATTSFNRLTSFTGIGLQKMSPTQRLGSSLAFLQDRTGADYLLGAYAYQMEQDNRRAAVQSVLSVALLASFMAPLTPPITPEYITIFLVDLRTGELVWCNVKAGVEVAAYNFTDLRDPQSVRKVVGELFTRYTGIAGTRHDITAETPSPPSRSVAPVQGGFAVQPPTGWIVMTNDTSITAFLHNQYLTATRFQLLPHRESFTTFGSTTSKGSSPGQLAESYVKWLRQRDLRDFEIETPATDAVLAGQSAFRIRYSFRQPQYAGGACMQVLVLGTALQSGVLIAEASAPRLELFGQIEPEFEAATRSIVRRPLRHLH
jgi:hypothetical protein